MAFLITSIAKHPPAESPPIIIFLYLSLWFKIYLYAENESSIEQKIPLENGGCFYELSFFALGEGAQVGFIATVTFETPNGPVVGGEITVRQQDVPNSNRDFGFYKLITTKAPDNATSVIVKFTVEAEGKQSLDLDDVSFVLA